METLVVLVAPSTSQGVFWEPWASDGDVITGGGHGTCLEHDCLFHHTMGAAMSELVFMGRSEQQNDACSPGNGLPVHTIVKI